jgi:hypothetical protein
MGRFTQPQFYQNISFLDKFDFWKSNYPQVPFRVY